MSSLGTQLVMIGKLFGDVLGLMASSLEPCIFIILNSLQGMEWAIGQTNGPFHLIFHVGTWPIYSHEHHQLQYIGW